MKWGVLLERNGEARTAWSRAPASVSKSATAAASHSIVSGAITSCWTAWAVSRASKVQLRARVRIGSLGPRPAGHLGYRVAVTYCNPSWWACLQMPNHALPAGPAVHQFIRRSHRRQRTRARHNLLIERITVQRLRVDVGPRPGDLQIFVAQLIHIVE